MSPVFTPGRRWSGPRIKRLREYIDCTQASLGVALSPWVACAVKANCIARWERGEVRPSARFERALDSLAEDVSFPG